MIVICASDLWTGLFVWMDGIWNGRPSSVQSVRCVGNGGLMGTLRMRSTGRAGHRFLRTRRGCGSFIAGGKTRVWQLRSVIFRTYLNGKFRILGCSFGLKEGCDGACYKVTAIRRVGGSRPPLFSGDAGDVSFY